MSNLFLHNQPVTSVYRLLGDDENALTFALGHCASEDADLRRELLRLFEVKGLGKRQLEDVEVRLQQYDATDRGYSDIEFYLPDRFRVIVEAKIKGGRPSARQLKKYKARLTAAPETKCTLAVIVEERADALRRDLEGSAVLDGIDVDVISWSDVRAAVRLLARQRQPSALVCQLEEFIREAYDMPVQYDAEVWVVSLSKKLIADGSADRLCDVPGKYGMYIFPTSYNPRKTLFIAFRFDGGLQSVHRILRDQPSVTSYRQVIPKLEVDAPTGEECTAYYLGPPIPLGHRPKTGKGIPQSALRYCDLDLLLTSETISEAVKLTIERRTNGTN